MSAPIGVYIGCWRCPHGNKEYRVAAATNIEDTLDPFNGDLFQATLFSDKTVYRDYVAALSEACRLADDLEQVHGTLEYGVVEKYYDARFPRVSVEEAKQKLSEFYGGYAADD